MTETQGFVAGLLLLITVFVYTFWPENSFATSRLSASSLKTKRHGC